MEEKAFLEYPSIGMDKVETLIWDWNGTLLDDVEANVRTINDMLSRRGMKQLDLATYKDLFCFPVKSFYQQIGFDLEKESIEEISVEYHSTYKSYEGSVRLNPDAPYVLEAVRRKGIKQYILSACVKNDLLRMINHFNLSDNFEKIYGADDICANGKVGSGKYLIQHHSLNPAKTLIIGDTLHDAEVAKAIGISYLLYSGGHNSYDLLRKETRVVASLKEIIPTT